MRRKKGFTFIELIIVLAIIAIFTAILVPTWGYFLDRSRTRTNNSRARIVFNAAQTAIVETQANESKWDNDVDHRYVPERGDFYFYWDGRNGFRCDADGLRDDSFAIDSADSDLRNQRFANAVNRILEEDDVAYKIFVHDSKVESVASARNANDPYIGIYPVTIQDREDAGFIDASGRRAIRNNGVVAVTLADFTV